jgi:hypothetical protein
MSVAFPRRLIFVIAGSHLYFFYIMLRLKWVWLCNLTIKFATFAIKELSVFVSVVSGNARTDMELRPPHCFLGLATGPMVVQFLGFLCCSSSPCSTSPYTA